MKPSNRAEKEARLRERNAEIAALVRPAEEEAAALRAVPDYDERRRQGIREVRRLAQWLRALAIAEDDANDESLRELVANAGRVGETWPVEVRDRVAVVIERPPRKKRGLGRLKLDAAKRAALRLDVQTARSVHTENLKTARARAEHECREVVDVRRLVHRQLDGALKAIAKRHGISVEHMAELTRSPAKSTRRKASNTV